MSKSDATKPLRPEILVANIPERLMKATMYRFETVKIADVVIPTKRIRVSRCIDSLACAIRQAGRLINPITVTEEMVLSAGLRRLLACKSLGWDTIPVQIISQKDLDKNLVEIAENLHREELTALERAEQTAAWKAAFLAKNQQAGHGKAPGNKGKGKGKAKAEGIKECKLHTLIGELEQATGRDSSTSRRDCQIAEAISQENRDAIRELPIADKQSELIKLARLDEEDQDDAVQLLSSGEASTVRQALNLIRGEELNSKPPPLPSGPFDVIVVDPPWHYYKRVEDASHRAALPYPSMTTDEIASLPICSIAAENCILWLWTTNSHIFEVPKVLSSWGFNHKSILTWAKYKMGTGDWLRGQTEHCILAVRGSPVVTLKNQTTLLNAPLREHSRKPEEFYELVESLCPGSKCELFSRTPRPGWTQHGNEINRFAEADERRKREEGDHAICRQTDASD